MGILRDIWLATYILPEQHENTFWKASESSRSILSKKELPTNPRIAPEALVVEATSTLRGPRLCQFLTPRIISASAVPTPLPPHLPPPLAASTPSLFQLPPPPPFPLSLQHRPSRSRAHGRPASMISLAVQRGHTRGLLTSEPCHVVRSQAAEEWTASSPPATGGRSPSRGCRGCLVSRCATHSYGGVRSHPG